MPVYEYQCKNCGVKFDIQRSLCDEDVEVKCPKCNSTDAQRVYSLFGRSSLDYPNIRSRFG